MTRDQDILVVGAGPVGLTAALELARRGFRPRIVDKADGPAGESRALGVHARTLEVLKPAGLTEQMLAEGVPIRRMRIREDGKPLLTLDLSKLRTTYPFILSLPQARTERLLMAALAARGVEVEWNTELVALDTPERPRVTLHGSDGETIVEPDLVVGADGARSAVRQACGIGFAGEQMPAEFGLADIRRKTPHDAHEAVVEVLPDGVLGFIPMSDRFGRYVSNHAEIMKLIPRPDDIEAVTWQSRFRISYRMVETFQKGCVFLAGDAAHIHSPVGGRGMNTGIEDAAWLAWLIEKGETGRYSADRMPVARKVLAFTHQQTNQILARGPVSNFVRRHVAPLLVAIDPVARLGLRRLTGLDTPRPPWLDGTEPQPPQSSGL